MELLGTTHNNVRVLHKGNLTKLRRIAKTLKHSAIYRLYDSKGKEFHSATDQAFLIEHYNDPYWLNQGVASHAPI